MGSVKDNLNKNDRIPSIWSRKTVADGSWLQYHTLNPLSARDEYLAECIDDLSASTDEKIIEERERAISAENELQDQIDTIEAATDVVDVQGTYADFTANSASYFPNNITFNDIVKVLNDEETTPTGHQTYWRLVPTGGSPKKPTPTNSKWDFVGYTDPYYSRQEVDNIVDGLSGTISSTYLSANDTAVSAGKNIVIDYDSENPYIKINTDDDVVFDNVSAEVSISAKSATIVDSTLSNVSSSNISATNLTALTANGTDAIFNNISAKETISAKSATIIDSTISNVSASNISATNLTALTANGTDAIFSNVSGTNISASNLTALTANGTDAIFTNFSGTNISGTNNTTTIDELITSAENGNNASAWLDANAKKYYSAISTATCKTVELEIASGYNNSGTTATIKASGYKTTPTTSTYLSGNTSDNYTSSFGLTDNANTYITQGHNIYSSFSGTKFTATDSTSTTTSYLSAGLCISAGSGLKWSKTNDTYNLGIVLGTTTVGSDTQISSIGNSALYSKVLSGGRCIEVNDNDNSINLSSTIDFKEDSQYNHTKTEISSNYIKQFYWGSQGAENDTVIMQANNLSASISRAAPSHGFTGTTTWDNVINASNGDFTLIGVKAGADTETKANVVLTTDLSSRNPPITGNLYYNGYSISATENTTSVTSHWVDIVKASYGDFTDKTITADLISTSSNGTTTKTTIINAGDISLGGGGGGGGASVKFDVTGMILNGNPIPYNTIKTGTYVSSNNTITALVSASTIGTQPNVLYLV